MSKENVPGLKAKLKVLGAKQKGKKSVLQER